MRTLHGISFSSKYRILVCNGTRSNFITQSDDDNIPNEHWGVPRFQGIFKNLEHDGFINIYKYFTDKTVWPRGLPLNKILETPRVQENKKECRVGVWQHLADKDTDVDAIYRLTSNQHIYFDQNEPLVLSTGTVSPFNCQSTTFQKDVYVLMYLPTSITPRASDIVRSLIAQPIMWQHGYLTGFTPPTVTQERNPHDYLKDFENEILIYLHAEDIFRITKNSLRDGASMSENLREAYQALINKELVPKKEMVVLEAWIKDIERIAKQ